MGKKIYRNEAGQTPIWWMTVAGVLMFVPFSLFLRAYPFLSLLCVTILPLIGLAMMPPMLKGQTRSRWATWGAAVVAQFAFIALQAFSWAHVTGMKPDDFFTASDALMTVAMVCYALFAVRCMLSAVSFILCVRHRRSR